MPPLLSVIVPTLNEADGIERTLRSVTRQADVPHELLIVDGGSTDRTCDIAGRYGRVISARRGRARQMNAGAREAAGDILLFLHADTVLPEWALGDIREALLHPAREAGAFRLRFDQTTPLLRFYSLFTHVRTPLLCFGDRGLFVRRDVFDHLGGFPDVPMFEDLELVRRLHRRGGFVFLTSFVTTSARRFRAVGPVRQQLRNAYLWLHYVAGSDPHALQHLYPYGVESPPFR